MVPDVMNASASSWMTHAAAADRLKVTPAMVADAATRLKWPSRVRDDGTAEIEVPTQVLLEAQALPDLRTSHERPTDVRAVEAAIKTAIQPLQQVIEELVDDLRASRAATDAVHVQRTVAEAAATTAREETAGATARAVRAGASRLNEELRREDVELELGRLKREMAALKARKRRWWWPG